MKNLILLALLISLSFSVYSQTSSTVMYYNWSNPETYKIGPTPVVTGFGELSDSLAIVYNVDFYEYDDSYYSIASWADYYLWFTHKYWFRFDQPLNYELYYHANDNYAMAAFVVNNYKGDYYPAYLNIMGSDEAPLKSVTKSPSKNDQEMFAYFESMGRKEQHMPSYQEAMNTATASSNPVAESNEVREKNRPTYPVKLVGSNQLPKSIKANRTASQ